MKKFKFLLSIILTAVVLAGCDIGDVIKEEATKELKVQSKKALDDIQSETFSKLTPKIKNSKDDLSLINADTNEENYAFVNDNKTSLSQADQQLINQKGNSEFWASYSDLDQLGRGGKVTALITYQAVLNNASSSKERPQFHSNVHLAGEYKDGSYDPMKQTWRGTQSNNQILQLEGYRGYIYNKSHSLAWSLGGDMETHNLTLGTREQNVGSNRTPEGGGMGYPETKVRDVIYDKPDTKVFYEVTPVYNGDELLPRGSHVRIYSINDNGQTINMNLWISNTQRGVQINYNDGTYTY
ncbi:DNA/RNA non-specific endonuclease [Mammaliicoccus sp. Dog046]|uniref:DNA/RNA non-specific endonuclease n=1 Tax=Mammaliicoccus sp. Dog046 TaxID=3034233 RepID=UPI002B2584F0|nr:DNA/RNA non-specific endonuclease [Mammaliicoccus sp. Dog046]WQK85814.1 DNA/RNA non-specific endonuclease [Mammaliicoccus sp. Dog046]